MLAKVSDDLDLAQRVLQNILETTYLHHIFDTSQSEFCVKQVRFPFFCHMYMFQE
jgi:hypothetical protein